MNISAVRLRKKYNPQKGPKCPYCGTYSKLQFSDTIYESNKYSPLWVCSNYPKCDAYVGTHAHGKWKGFPKGSLANATLRQLRKEVHFILDPLWKSGKYQREYLYKHLRGCMQLTEPVCHIGEFDENQCKLAKTIIERDFIKNKGTSSIFNETSWL